MREIRPYGSEGGGAARSPYPYLIEPQRGVQTVAQGGTSGKSRWCRPGSAFPQFVPSPPTRLLCWGRGLGGGGRPGSFAKITLRDEKCLDNNETRDSITNGPPLPTSPPESPKRGRFGERGDEWVGTLTQGGARGDCGPELLPSPALGYLPTPLQGSQDEAAASLPLHFLKKCPNSRGLRLCLRTSKI